MIKKTAATKRSAKKPATKAKPAKKAAAKKPAAKKPAAKKPGAKKPAANKPAANKPAAPRKRTPVAVEFTETVVAVVEEPTPAIDDSDAAKKTGALSRLKTGVGKLFAKVTGRKRAETPSDGVPDAAVEVVTADIIQSRETD